MGRPSYSELLRDPRWQRRRLEILQRDDWKCCRCARGDLNLQVHHKHYVRGKKPWEYAAADLETMCDGCHSDESLTVIRIDREDGVSGDEWSVWFRAPIGMLELGSENGAHAWTDTDRRKPNARVSRNCLPSGSEVSVSDATLIAEARASLLMNLGRVPCRTP